MRLVKKLKNIQSRKEETKLSLFIIDMTVYTDNPRNEKNLTLEV
jgi:hypothetical protein